MRRRRLRLLLLFAVAMLAGGIGVLAYGNNAFRALENDSVDARFSIRGDEKPPANIVIVGVDDTTIQHLNLQWPYPRTLHAKVIERLHSLGAKAIAVDILFDLPENAPKKPCDFAGIDLAPGDCALLVATGNASNVIYSEVEAGPGGITPFVGQKGGAGALKALGATPAFTGISEFKYAPWSLKILTKSTTAPTILVWSGLSKTDRAECVSSRSASGSHVSALSGSPSAGPSFAPVSVSPCGPGTGKNWSL